MLSVSRHAWLRIYASGEAMTNARGDDFGLLRSLAPLNKKAARLSANATDDKKRSSIVRELAGFSSPRL